MKRSRFIGNSKRHSGLDVSAWLFQKLSSDLADAGHDLSSISGKAALAKEAVRWISTMPEGAFRQLMVDEVGQRTGVTQQRLDQMAESAQSTRLLLLGWDVAAPVSGACFSIQKKILTC